MQLSKNFHLSYCSNIHSGNDWKSHFKNIKKYVPIIKKQVCPNKNFGLGLRLSNLASKELDSENNLSNFKDWLKEENIYIFTMNGFPYGNFHGNKVKDLVHEPDWTNQDRVNYTTRLFNQLAYLLPEKTSGGISTSPISYKHWHKTIDDKKTALKIGAENMIKIIFQLYEIEKKTNKYLHLDIEPEPDGLLENSNDVINFYQNYLYPIGIEKIKSKFNINDKKARDCIKKYLTICYDICHFSLAYEDPKDTFNKFNSNQIKIGKIQVSSALKIIFNKNNEKKIWDSLEKFDEPVYLHQVTEYKNNKVKTYPDLPELFLNKKSFKELRAHFHVPIFLEEFDHLSSTQDQILKVINYINTNKTLCDHLEIETYTWEVLPSSLKTEIASSIIREIEWLKLKL